MERIPCDQNTPCALRETIGCFEDVHHEAYPKSAYRGKLEKKFRDNIMNKVLMCRTIHNEEHAQMLPPKKPEPQEMRRLINEHDESVRRTRKQLR